MFDTIEAERVRRKVSRRAFAKMLGVTERTVWNWQNGITEIPVSKVMALAQAWGCSTDHLLGLDTKIKTPPCGNTAGRV